VSEGLERAEVARWLDAYVKAWKSYDRGQIEALFAEDVEYRYHPYDEPVVGRDAVIASWLGEGDHEGASSRDAAGTYDASYEPMAVDGPIAVATGTSSYLTGPGGAVEVVYDNCFVIRFDGDGRCREFTEWYVKRPAP
jgi:ketosteroid isomerase-like protein